MKKIRCLISTFVLLIVFLSSVSYSQQYNQYDTDQDWKIGDFELLNAIDEWATGNLGDFDLLDLIDFWAAGSYCWDAVTAKYRAGICEAGLPPNPADVAPVIDPTVVSSMDDVTEFLYTGADPVQTGVPPGTIVPMRVGVIRGLVLDRNSLPLPAVTITVAGHPEYGQTLSRADGMFDLAVNGGGQLTVNYVRDGYLPVQRQLNVPWQDFAWLENVVMIPVDPQVTTVQLNNATMQVARGSPVTDTDGTRQATVLVPAGTGAEVILQDGSTQAVSSLNVHITEYTIGDNGPLAMPAQLPPTSGYTYAIELTAEEAISKVDGKDVLFDQPVYLYVEDFIGFPVGSAVPVGYYNADRHQWVASENGRVISILGISGGLADLDTDGNDQIDDAVTLAAIGVTDAERQQLAGLYAPGQTLWRVPITHFSTYDCNWPYGLPPNSSSPNQPGPDDDTNEDGPNCSAGSIIECQNQVLGKSIPVVGTPHTINYRSDRTPGRLAAYSLTIPLSDNAFPLDLLNIELVIDIAGQRFHEVFLPGPNLSHTFTWDGRNAYGTVLQGKWPATIQLQYNYRAVYYPSSSDQARSFAQVGPQTEVVNGRTDSIIRLVQRWQTELGVIDARRVGLGGWTLDKHHLYDPSTRAMYLGTGRVRSAVNESIVMNTEVGIFLRGGPYGTFCGDGGPAIESCLYWPAALAIAPDGSLYIADSSNHRIRRVDPQGIITTVAGVGTAGATGDGGPAIAAELWYPSDIAIAPDGSLYIADPSNHRIRRVDPNGIISTVAGGGNAPWPDYGDGGLAVDAQLNFPSSVAVTSDNTLYIGDNSRMRRVGPDGFITTAAGTGIPDYNGDGIAATAANISDANDIVVAADGSVIFIDGGNTRVRRIGTDGIISTIAGDGTSIYVGDGMLATETGLETPSGIAMHPDGSLYIAGFGLTSSYYYGRIHRIDQNGFITTIAGGADWDFEYAQEGMPATAVWLNYPDGIAFGQDGSLLVADSGNHVVRRLSSFLQGASVADIVISSEDGSELYVFEPGGRHLQTLNSLTGATLFEFAYDAGGRLLTITDGDGNVTTIERDGAGNPTGILSPDAQRTVWSLDAQGYLNALANPANESIQFAYTSAGLLTSMTDARSNSSIYTYDNLGRLVSAEDAAGGSKTLTRGTFDNGYEVTLTTALGRVSKYRVEQLPMGGQRRLNTLPNGTQTETIIGTDGSETTTYPDGTMAIVQEGPDPRWGMAAPTLSSIELKSDAAGISQLISEFRSVTLADPDNSLSLETFERIFDVNGKSYTDTYNTTTGRMTTITPEGRQIVSDLDSQGRTTRVEVGGLAPTFYTYDGRGRLDAIVQGSGAEARTTTMTYGPDGFVDAITDPIGQRINFDHDGAGRITAHTRPDSQTIEFGYDVNGNLALVTPSGRPAHAFTYTPVNRLDIYTPPDVGIGNDVTDNDYDLDRQPSLVTRPDAKTMGFNYDSAGRLLTLTIPRGTAQYAYDATSGNLSTITAPDNGDLNFIYTGPFLTANNWTGSVVGSVEYSYDNDFHVASIGVNGGNIIGQTYDNDGLLTQAGSLTLVRDGQHGLITATTLSAVTDTRNINSFAEFEGYSAAFNSTTLFDVQYTRDKLGRITTKTETIGSSTDVYDYSYDAAGRLIEVKRNTVVTETYSYDSNGNRLSHNGIGGSYDDQDRLSSYGSTTYSYTANGELQSKTDGGQTTNYSYDVLGNLIHVTLPDGTSLDYIIDGSNRRIGKQVNGTLVQGFLYKDQLNPIAELDGSNNVVAQFVYGSKSNVPDYMKKDGLAYRIISDHLGSPRVVVDATTGVVVQRMDFDEFGRVIADTNPGFQPFGFAGGIYDNQTGLTRFGKRDYDSNVGRWTAKDHDGFSGGTNLYAYVNNAPIDRFDPSGLVPVDVTADEFLQPPPPGKPEDPLLSRKRQAQIAVGIGKLMRRTGCAADMGDYARSTSPQGDAISNYGGSRRRSGERIFRFPAISF